MFISAYIAFQTTEKSIFLSVKWSGKFKIHSNVCSSQHYHFSFLNRKWLLFAWNGFIFDRRVVLKYLKAHTIFKCWNFLKKWQYWGQSNHESVRRSLSVTKNKGPHSCLASLRLARGNLLFHETWRQNAFPRQVPPTEIGILVVGKEVSKNPRFVSAKDRFKWGGM